MMDKRMMQGRATDAGDYPLVTEVRTPAVVRAVLLYAWMRDSPALLCGEGLVCS